MDEIEYNNNYHLYMDEGGMFGNCTIAITNKKLKKADYCGDISNYYFGKCCGRSILRLLQMFKELYPKCLIEVSDKSDISMTESEYIEFGEY